MGEAALVLSQYRRSPRGSVSQRWHTRVTPAGLRVAVRFPDVVSVIEEVTPVVSSANLSQLSKVSWRASPWPPRFRWRRLEA